MPYVKSGAPPDVLDVVRKAEAQADDCWRALQIRYYPIDLATWAVLRPIGDMGNRLVRGHR